MIVEWGWKQSDQLERKAPTPVHEDDLEKKLKNALRSKDPSSLWQVARSTPHQPRILREYFPEVCGEISRKFQESRHQEFQEKKRKVKKRVRELVESFHERGIYPSKPKIEKKLSNPGYLNLSEVRQAWKESLQELGYAV